MGDRLWDARGWIVLVGLLAAGVSVPFWADVSVTRELIELACYVSLALAWNLLAGYGGLVSIGQQAFFGAGAYAVFAAVNLAGWSPWPSILAGGAVAVLLALLVAPLLFRLQGGYFAIGSWVVAEALRLVVSNAEPLGGSSGMSVRFQDGLDAAQRNALMLWVALALTFGVLAGTVLLLRSRLGLALSALRDNRQAAESQGVPVRRVQLAVFALAALVFGLFGAIYYLAALRVSPAAAFDVRWAVLVIFMVVIGGVGSIEGPILGAVLFFVLDRAFSEYGTWWLVALGATAVLCAMHWRGGLWGALEALAGRSLTLFPARWHGRRAAASASERVRRPAT